MYVQSNFEAIPHNNFSLWKSKNYYLLYVFVALVIQHAKRIRHVVTCGLSGPTISSSFSHKRHKFGKKELLKVKCEFWFSIKCAQ
jgi:hypothetical protein